MRHRFKHFAAPIAMLVLLLTIAPMVALAATYVDIPMNHTNGYDGTNNWYTASAGVFKLRADGNNHYVAHTGNVYWSLDSITWIRNSTQNNRYQPAMVFHARNYQGTNCGHGYYESYWSDLPGNWSRTKPDDLGCDNNELRVGAGLPWGMQAWQYYYTEGTWVDQSGFSGEIDFDNYWLDTQPPPWNPGGVIIRDYQAKLCHNNNSVSQPDLNIGFKCP